MFEGIKRYWAEARADVVSKQVDDILQRYDRMNSNDRYWVFSAFNSALSEVEDELGSGAQWSIEQKKEVAKQIMLSSQKAFSQGGSGLWDETTRLSAHGGALLSLYLELQTLPGDQAVRVVKAIDQWRHLNGKAHGPHHT